MSTTSLTWRSRSYHRQWLMDQVNRRFDFLRYQHFLDHERGGWHEELTEDMRPSPCLFTGKADIIYHDLQARLTPLYPATGSLTRGIATSI